nr:14005_t:CDS:10 [Entrophospora candida]CAG8510865.1 9028_t:CDS:10 [Entrophospora candida]
MAPFNQRPENALKRAEELIAVGQNVAALQSLHDIVLSIRSRTIPLPSFEPIMLRFIELCVNLRKGKTAKEGLYQFKHISQSYSVATIELVIKRFLELAEEKVTTAQAKADQITLETVDDLEASETPESIMLSTVSGEQSKDRTDRAVVTPWLKFLWEAYRTALDFLRNNVRLEVFYQQTAHQAFQFCLKYTRKTEFRRLCELLRNHLQNIAKYPNQTNLINLNEPETLKRHLDTRFYQLNAAVELELWQEAFRSVEDIHNLLSLSKGSPKPMMMANYYDKLTKIFLVGENYLFHAAAWNCYYTLVKTQNKSLSDEENTRMASFVLLSVLAIPVITNSKTRLLEIDDNKNKQHRLAILLGMSRAPTRTGLLKEALNKHILRKVQPELRDLYNILEVQFHPLSICKKIEPIVNHLSQDTEMAKYVKPLHQVILTRLFQQLSQVYDTVKLDFIINLASFAPPYNYEAATIEKFIMNGCKKGELSIRIDHATKSLTFETDIFLSPKITDSDGAKLQASPTDQMREQLSKLSKCFYTAVHMIDPSIVEAKKQAKSQTIAHALSGMEDEHNNALARKAIIERRRELLETLLMRQEKEEQRQRAIRQKQRDEELKQRQLEEAKKRESLRRKREYEAIQKEEVRKFAESLKAKKLNVQPEDLENLDPDRLVQLQVEHIEKEKKELGERLRTLAKRMDHLERAYRKEEIPLLVQDYEKQKKTDRELHDDARKMQLEAAASKHTENLKIKSRLMIMLPDYQQYRKDIENKRFEEFEEHQMERAEAERQEKEKAQKAEYEAKKRKLDEQAARQREREEEAEQRRLKRELEQKAKDLERQQMEDKEKKKAQDAQEKISAPKSSYIPPALRKQLESTSQSPIKSQGRVASGRGANIEEPQRRRTEETTWRRSETVRSNTIDADTLRTEPGIIRKSDPHRSTDDGSWRGRQDSSRGSERKTGTSRGTDDGSWRSRQDSGAADDGLWRRSNSDHNFGNMTHENCETNIWQMMDNSLDYMRFQNHCRLKSSWARIIKRYQDVSDEEADVIDLITQEIIINRGIIQNDNIRVLGECSGKSTEFCLDGEKGKDTELDVNDNDNDDDHTWKLDAATIDIMLDDTSSEELLYNKEDFSSHIDYNIDGLCKDFESEELYMTDDEYSGDEGSIYNSKYSNIKDKNELNRSFLSSSEITSNTSNLKKKEKHSRFRKHKCYIVIDSGCESLEEYEPQIRSKIVSYDIIESGSESLEELLVGRKRRKLGNNTLYNNKKI